MFFVIISDPSALASLDLPAGMAGEDWSKIGEAVKLATQTTTNNGKICKKDFGLELNQ